MQVFHGLHNPGIDALLKTGAVGVLPTDTVYGLVCRAQDPGAVRRLFTVKKRDANPGTVLAANIQQLIDLGMKARYLKAVEYFWPNPISIVIPCGDELTYLHQGKHSLAVRIPDSVDLRAFLEVSGPLMTTSANHAGESTARTMQQAEEYFGETVDFYVDGGNMGDRQPSTIIRVVDDAIEVLREGVVKIDETGKIHRG
ncbi:threonylcarbamoyl-AMP synthase [Candidatus Saccharibacteria bacterium]|nr:MAG: threonylcarbamoyl-AMP synthase [Candidatus Saccharibacteria bacterium]